MRSIADDYEAALEDESLDVAAFNERFRQFLWLTFYRRATRQR